MNYQFSFFSVKFSGNNVEENREIIESRNNKKKLKAAAENNF